MYPMKGTIVIHKDNIGAVRYIGPLLDDTSYNPTIYVGIELAEPLGNCDGQIGNVQYFRTHNTPNFGIMCPLDQIDKVVSPFEMLEKLTTQHGMLRETIEVNRELTEEVANLQEKDKTNQAQIQNQKSRIEMLELKLEQALAQVEKHHHQRTHERNARGTRHNSVDEFTFVNYHPLKGKIVVEDDVMFASAERDTVVDDNETFRDDRETEPSSTDSSEDSKEEKVSSKKRRSHRSPKLPQLQQTNSLAQLIDKVSSEARHKLKMRHSHSGHASEEKPRSRRRKKYSRSPSPSPPFRVRVSPRKTTGNPRLEVGIRSNSPSLPPIPDSFFPLRPRSCPPPSGTDPNRQGISRIMLPLEQSSSAAAVYSLTPPSNVVSGGMAASTTLLTPPGRSSPQPQPQESDLPALVEYESPLPILNSDHSGASSLHEECDHQNRVSEVNFVTVAQRQQNFVVGDLFTKAQRDRVEM